jgi:hypothetical protein
VLVAEARLTRRWPGGPLTAQFLARHGPDGAVLGRFMLSADDESELDAMLDTAARQIDEIYAEALRSGRLQAEAGLAVDLEPVIAPAPFFEAPAGVGSVVNDQVVGSLELVAATPDAASFAALEAALRRVPGVTNVAVTSLSLGGSSRLLISYVGDELALRASLSGRGLALGSEVPLPVLRRGAVPPAAAAPTPPPPAEGEAPADLLPAPRG